MIIFPAIDLKNGQCVRLFKGDMNQATVFNDNPSAQALEFENAGFKFLHLVDLDGAKAGKIINLRVLEAIASNTQLVIDFGGGIKSEEDLNSTKL